MDKPAIVTKQDRQLLERCRPPASATNEKRKRIIHREPDEVVFGRQNK